MSKPIPRRRGLAVLLGAVLISGAGCTSSAPTTASETSNPSSSTAAAAIEVPPVSVTLTDPGQEPRSTLGLRLGTAAPQQVTLTTQASIVQQIGEQDSVDLSSPEISVPLTATTTADSTRPAAQVALAVGTPTSPDSILTDSLTKEAGSSAALTVIPNAAVTGLSITANDAALDTARSAVEQALRQAVQLAVALPADPVGVGARWTVSQQLDSLGLPLRQDIATTLTAVDGSRVALAVTLSQTPLANTWSVPGGGGQLSVDSYPMQGTGTVTVDLAAPLPVAGSLTLAGKQVYTSRGDGTVLSQDVTNRVGWSS